MKTFLFLKKTAAIAANQLGESNGSVENVLGMKTTTEKAPCFLRFAPKAKGLVSFVQNLLSPPDAKGGVCCGQVFAFFQSAAAAAVVLVGIGFLKAKKAVSAVAAAVVGIGLLTAPIDSAQGQGSGVPTVVSVDITSCSFGSFTFDQELSATYYWPNGYFRSVSYSSCYYTGGYTVVELVPAVWGWDAVRMEWNWIPDLDSEWFQIGVWMGSDSDPTPPSAFVYDSTNSSSPSAGTPYYVDLYVDGYLVSGHSVE